MQFVDQTRVERTQVYAGAVAIPVLNAGNLGKAHAINFDFVQQIFSERLERVLKSLDHLQRNMGFGAAVLVDVVERPVNILV